MLCHISMDEKKMASVAGYMLSNIKKFENINSFPKAYVHR